MEYSPKDTNTPSVKFFEQRAILQSEQLNIATLENFHCLHENVIQTVPLELRPNFRFDNSANFLIDYPFEDKATMFAICTEFSPCSNLRFLKAGKYLCCKCTDENRNEKIGELLRIANCEYKSEPKYIVLSVKFTGLFCWQYEIQLPLY